MNIKPLVQTDRVVVSKRKPQRGLKLLVAFVAIVILAAGSLVAVPIVSPSAGAAMADWLRGIIGPEAVAEIESVAFQLQDVFNRARYQASGGQAQISWADPTVTVTQPTAKPAPSKAAPAAPSTLKDAELPVQRPTIAHPVDVMTAPSSVTGWQAFGATTANGEPIMARTVVNPDQSRPYAQAALVRIDLSKVQLHLVAGTVEPVAVKGTPALSRPGDIPATDQVSGILLAAFNGGFKSIHGNYGVQIDGVTIRPPLDDMATLGLYKGGTVKIGAWGRDIQSSSDLITYRQNCPLLVDAGQINPHVTDESRKEWGYTVKNLDTTWRSGVGLSQDGRFLIYAAGNSLTVESLARALQQAGAQYAMQLDINGFYTRFVTYTQATGAHTLTANKLLKEMSGDPLLFLRPYDRDFFYITAKHSA